MFVPVTTDRSKQLERTTRNWLSPHLANRRRPQGRSARPAAHPDWEVFVVGWRQMREVPPPYQAWPSHYRLARGRRAGADSPGIGGRRGMKTKRPNKCPGARMGYGSSNPNPTRSVDSFQSAAANATSLALADLAKAIARLQ